MFIYIISYELFNFKDKFNLIEIKIYVGRQMVVGLVAFSWHRKLGPVIDLKHPNTLQISDNLINKIYMTHTYHDENKKQNLVETTANNLIILSYCDKDRVSEVGYEIISIIIEEKEKIHVNKIKQNFIAFSQALLNFEKDKKMNYFYEHLGLFFTKNTARKLLLLGRAGTGKTSIKEIIFEGKDPNELLIHSLEPTRGISPNVYSWLDLKLGVFDSSGQELSYLLENEADSDFKLAFENTDIIVYVIDYTFWNSKREEMLSEVQKISQIIKMKDLPSSLSIFVHKVDLIDKPHYSDVIRKLEKELLKIPNITIHFTSIHPELIYNLYNAFYDLLSSSSHETMSLMSILKTHIGELSNTMAFITNLQDSIIVQSMSSDFKTNLINHSHKLIAGINQNFEEMSQEGKIDHLILSSEDNFNIILNNMNMSKFGLKYLIVLSETLSANKLILLIGQVRTKIKNYYYLERKST
ncbi:MAG: hypothetical protein EU521_01580 [Promethearchaeota archaeon]|nr:MAG: hypothetical protein EU521_01580 [Candidatus Lokiarchaeota archaeon]